jgi:hypothetical protein
VQEENISELLCAIEHVCKALCLDLILGKVDLVRSVYITCPVRSLALWLSAQEKTNVEIEKKTNKEEESVGGRSPTLR